MPTMRLNNGAESRPVGRPRVLEAGRSISFYLGAEDRARCAELGGSAWLRGVIEREWARFLARKEKESKK